MTPKSLNVVGVNLTINNKLQLTVVTYLVIITFGVKSVVCVRLVSEDGSPLFNSISPLLFSISERSIIPKTGVLVFRGQALYSCQYLNSSLIEGTFWDNLSLNEGLFVSLLAHRSWTSRRAKLI